MLDSVFFPSCRSFPASLRERILYAKPDCVEGIAKASKWWQDFTEYPNLRFAEGCREILKQISRAVLADQPHAVNLHHKIQRQGQPAVQTADRHSCING